MSDRSEKSDRSDASDRSDQSDFSGVILAAGQGRRAGGNKLLWPLGTGRVIDLVIKAQASVCSRVRVVAGAYYDDLKRHIESIHDGVEVICNEHWETGGMFSSVQLGLKDAASATFIQPGDIPGATAEVYRALKSSYENNPAVDFIKPKFEGRGGHPLLLSEKAVGIALKQDAHSNMREVLSKLSGAVVAVDEPLIVRDIDTEQQYLELKSIFDERHEQGNQTMIAITVNGFEEKIPSDSLVSSLIEKFKESDSHLVVEYNGRVLYPTRWANTTVKPGDSLEFIHPCFGG